MPRAFTLTSASDSVSLDVSGQGEVSFTVSNALGKPVRARVSVLASGVCSLATCTAAASPCPCQGNFLTCVGRACFVRAQGMMVLREYQEDLRRIASGLPRGGIPRPSGDTLQGTGGAGALPPPPTQPRPPVKLIPRKE